MIFRKMFMIFRYYWQAVIYDIVLLTNLFSSVIIDFFGLDRIRILAGYLCLKLYIFNSSRKLATNIISSKIIHNVTEIVRLIT